MGDSLTSFSIEVWLVWLWPPFLWDCTQDVQQDVQALEFLLQSILPLPEFEYLLYCNDGHKLLHMETPTDHKKEFNIDNMLVDGNLTDKTTWQTTRKKVRWRWRYDDNDDNNDNINPPPPPPPATTVISFPYTICAQLFLTDPGTSTFHWAWMT